MLLVKAIVVSLLFAASTYSYLIGTGISDITGPSTEINFMGYAVPSQRGSGIHLRLRSRAFIIADEETGKRVCYVSVDGGMGSDLVNKRVVDALKDKFGDLYTAENIAISGTHTHSGPGGFLQYVLYHITSLGFVQETFDAWVNGIVESIEQAHNRLVEGDIFVNQGNLYDSNINRSPTSYLLNPEDERAQYPDGDTDKNMLLLKFVNGANKQLLGSLNWFAVHATSMNNTNTLVSGDNKGYASYVMEKEMNGASSEPGKGPFVAAFASTNLGDVSPNTRGPKCIDTGEPCDGSTSTCNGKCQNCIAFGPGTDGDMFESTQIIGDNQFQHAMNLMNSAINALSGSVDYRQSFVKMVGLNVSIQREGRTTLLCKPAMGYSFAAGTTDGPGMFNFSQGTTSGNPFWDHVRDFLSEPTQEEIDCQAPKPILFNTGDLNEPYPWDPETVSVSILRVGNLFILVQPAELTTMAGRRLRKAIYDVIIASGIIPAGQQVYITIAGLANGYASYVTTYEEYQAQRYEAASTIFGPYTLDGYIQEFTRIAEDMVKGLKSTTGPPPEDLTDVLIELMPPARFDRTPLGTKFGDVIIDALPSYTPGQTASVEFRSANPRHNTRSGGTYLKVQRSSGVEQWTDVAVDGDWETKFHWINKIDDPLAFGISAISFATVEWNIPSNCPSGNYRICHSGDALHLLGGELEAFEGCSSVFVVTPLSKK